MANQMLMEGAVAVILLVIIVGVGATVVDGVRDTQTLSINTVTVTNESVAAAVAGRNYALTGAASYGNYNNVSVVVANATQNPISILNYTFYDTNGSITVQWSGSIFNVTYQWEYASGNADYNISSAGLVALITYSNFFTVIVVTLVFAAIIGLFALFAVRGRGTQGGL